MKKPNTYVVRVCYYEPDNSFKDTLLMDTFACESEAEAIAQLERVIRDDWTAEVETDSGAVSLADCRGQTQGDYGQHGYWSYAKDGKTAWMFYSNGYGYKGEVVEL